MVLSNEQRQAVYQELLTMLKVDGKPVKGSFSVVAVHFGVGWRTISRIWSRAKEDVAAGALVPCVATHFKNCGRTKSNKDVFSVLTSIPFSRRTTLRSMAAASGIPRSTLGRLVKEGAIRPHSNSIKPLLTNCNKIARLQFCLSMLQPSSNSFHDMYDVIHVDEKWFYMTKASKRYYLADGELEPLRTCKSKRFIEKVMFLAAVARPKYDHHRKTMFNGKIGIWPFVVKEPAKRASKNRPAGTMITKPVMVGKDQYRDMLLENVLPAIRLQWPRATAARPIFIQQDNAKPHISMLDEAFTDAARTAGFHIRLRCQPPNSPDMNVLDLGFFNAIQSLQHQSAPKNVDELIVIVEKAFHDLDVSKLNYVFLTWQQCMLATLEDGGGNGYKIPHMGKESLNRAGTLPVTIDVEQGLLDSVRSAVSSV